MKQKNVFPYILLSVVIHILIFLALYQGNKKRELPELIEVSFDSPTSLPEPLPEPEPVKPEPPKKQTLKEAKKKIVSDEKSNIKVTDDDDAIQPEDLKVDAEIFKFPQYAKSMRKKIAETWKHDKWNNLNLRVEVFFRIHRDGSVTGVRIKKSSGNASFDENGVNTIKAAAPFDKLPENFTNNTSRSIFVFQKGKV
jgi:TonB family protein